MWVDRAGPPISKPIRTAVPGISRASTHDSQPDLFESGTMVVGQHSVDFHSSRNCSKSAESRLLGAILEDGVPPLLTT
ncbi:9916_t:CDS:2 [Acaulospora colombiana]|uniref:9916_t:CDS:1 n=1 Tax=Acaulospora colombiana TaxID=27376 RepID=A0ACA9MYY2_9GLOM|nr:9916_t:CDS:2 [Acaulospora colombiana]